MNHSQDGLQRLFGFKDEWSSYFQELVHGVVSKYGWVGHNLTAYAKQFMGNARHHEGTYFGNVHEQVIIYSDSTIPRFILS